MKINPIVVDLSHYQDVQDWDRVKAAGVVGVINKVSEGVKSVDKTFGIRRGPVKNRDLLFGGYHFLRPGSIPDQVSFFLKAIGDTNDILFALDHEDPKVPLADAKAFMSLVKTRTGRYPILYSGFLIKQQLGSKRDPELDPIRLWLSHYNANPSWPPQWVNPWLWQFTGDGQGPQPHAIDGIKGTGIDINSYGGTPDQLRSDWLK